MNDRPVGAEWLKKEGFVSNSIESCVVVGIGYIGLPTAAVIARSGVAVTGVDIDAGLVERVSRGRTDSIEPGLAELVRQVVASGHLKAQTTVPPADAFIIAVPTPFEGGFKPDLSFVRAAANAIAPVLQKGNLVLVESTIPVGSTEQVARWLGAARPDLRFSRRSGPAQDEFASADIFVAHSPERILPGRMLVELSENDRIIGGVCRVASRKACEFYRRFVKGNCIATDSRTAELCKLSENAFRDVNIAFANELAGICDETDIDVWELIRLANRHPRVSILKPGPGVGGHCIAVDPWFIVSALADKSRLIREARWVNSARPRQVAAKILQACRRNRVRSISCLGLAYKADVDDFRESPAVEVTTDLVRDLDLAGLDVEVRVCDPHLGATRPAMLAELAVTVVDLERALEADMLVLLVDHKEFIAIPEARLAGKILFDTRGMWPTAAARMDWSDASSAEAAE